jgi:hypothetical protein
VIAIDATFRETTAETKLEATPLAHLSVELGHLYMEDFAAGPAALGEQLRRVAYWAGPASGFDLPAKARVSTCFLIDDYFTPFGTPAEVLPMLLRVAEEAGLRIDYLAREASCADADGVPLAKLVAERLTAVPPPGVNGSRPPALDIGWLSNGERSPIPVQGEAMRRTTWAPPVEIDARNHSVFVDVELWNEPKAGRLWSCAFLAAVWQLLRLGLIRDVGANVVRPRHWDGGAFPDSWAELPPILQLNRTAKPFCAYRTMSLLPARFLQVESAVRVVLSQVAPNPDVLDQIAQRAGGENIGFPPELIDRVSYVFFNG